MKLVFPRLYVIMDAALLGTSELAFAELLAQSGVELVQYRNKKASSRRLLQVSRELASFFRSTASRFVVNDRADVAALAGAHGVHLGQQDLPVETARALCGPGCWVGVSTHNFDQVREAAATSADYLAVGPLFPTATKEFPEPLVGLEVLRSARRATSKPLVAIGGITLTRAEEVFRAGADSVAVARDILAASDPPRRVWEYLDLAARIRGE